MTPLLLTFSENGEIEVYLLWPALLMPGIWMRDGAERVRRYLTG